MSKKGREELGGDKRIIQPLSGILVLDLCRNFAGCYTSMFFGDFGAEVIKIDPPAGSKLTKSGIVQSERIVAHFAPNRNKKSIVIDLKHEQGLERATKKRRMLGE